MSACITTYVDLRLAPPTSCSWLTDTTRTSICSSLTISSRTAYGPLTEFYAMASNTSSALTSQPDGWYGLRLSIRFVLQILPPIR